MRTERESDSKRREVTDFMVLPRPAKSVQNGAGFSGKTGTYWACRKRKSGLSATERAVGKNAGAALAKRKRNRAVCQEYQIMRGRESRWARATPWRERGGSEREHREKTVDSTVNESKIPRRKGRASKKSLPRRSKKEHDLHQSTAASTWWCGPRPRLGWVEMAVGLPEGPR